MSYVAIDPASFAGQVVGNGQCVGYVRAASPAPVTSDWTEGEKVRGADVAVGTIIATFVGGVYPNLPTGNHAAVYMGQDAIGIDVWDQWVGQPVHQRKIRFKGGVPPMSNDGDAFSVVE